MESRTLKFDPEFSSDCYEVPQGPILKDDPGCLFHGEERVDVVCPSLEPDPFYFIVLGSGKQ